MDPVVHFEMPAEDKKRMSEFYTKVFGWQSKQLGPEMMNYVLVTTTETDEHRMVKTPGTINGGFAEKTADNSAPSVVISVEDIQKSMEKVTEAGGKILSGPHDIPGVGKFTSFLDTEGNKVSMLEPSNM